MKLTPPKKITWWISLILAAAGLVSSLVTIPVLSSITFWLVLVSAALMLVGTAMKGI